MQTPADERFARWRADLATYVERFMPSLDATDRRLMANGALLIMESIEQSRRDARAAHLLGGHTFCDLEACSSAQPASQRRLSASRRSRGAPFGK